MIVSIVLVSVVTTRNPSAHVIPNTGRSTTVARKADLQSLISESRIISKATTTIT